MLFGGEVDDDFAGGLVDVQPAYLQSALLTQAAIFLVHGRVALLEGQGQPFTHHANGVDGVDQGLGRGVEEGGGEVGGHILIYITKPNLFST